jgi:hypothetical protein
VEGFCAFETIILFDLSAYGGKRRTVMWKKIVQSASTLALLLVSGVCFGEETTSQLTYQEKQKLSRNEHTQKCLSVNKNSSSALKSTSRQFPILAGLKALDTISVPPTAVNIPDGTHISGATHWNQSDYYVHGMVYVDPNVLFAISGNIYFDSSAANAGIFLGPNVKFIAEGKPDNPITIQSDTGTGYDDYDFFIKVDPLTNSIRVRYCEIYDANRGIWPVGNGEISTIKSRIIQDCVFLGNYIGVKAEGPMELTVTNCNFVNCFFAGVDISVVDANGLLNPGSSYTVKGNTINGNQYYGIGVYGVPEWDGDTGPVNLSDNLIVGSQVYAVASTYWRSSYLSNCQGYYANNAIAPPGDPEYPQYTFSEANAVYLTQDPFQNGRNQYPFYLRHGSGLIDKGSEPISQSPQLGKFTCLDTPDANVVDIGVHYFMSEYSNAGISTLSADLTNDGIVDYNDLGLFTSYWLYDYNDNYNCWSWDFDDSGSIDINDFKVIADNWLTSFDFVDFADFAHYWRRTVDYKFQDRRFDLNGDTIVDFKDFAMFADQWRQKAEITNPMIYATVSGDPQNQKGTIAITANNARSTMFVGVYVDGLPVGIVDYRIDPCEYSDVITFDSTQLPNGQHEIKLAAVDSNGVVTLSENLTITVLNDFYYFTKDDGFDNTGLNIFAINASSKEIRVKIYSWADGSLRWTSDTMAGNLNCHIPPSIFTQYPPQYICDINIETRSVTPPPLSMTTQSDPIVLLGDADWESRWTDAITRNYDPQGGYRVQIYLPRGDSWWSRVADCRKKAVAELARWGAGTGSFAVWYYDAANWKTFSTQMRRSTTEVVYYVSHGYKIYNGVEVANFLISGPTGGLEYVLSKPKAGLPPVGTPGIHYMRELNLCSEVNPWRYRFFVYHSACWIGYNQEMAREWMNGSMNEHYATFPDQMPLWDVDWQEWDYLIWKNWCDSRTSWSDALKKAKNADPKGELILEKLKAGSLGDEAMFFN